MINHNTSPFFGIEKLIPYLRKYRRTMLVMTVLGLMGSTIDIAVPLFQKYALDIFVVNATFKTMLPFTLIYIGTIFLTAINNYWATRMAMKVEMYVDRDLRNAAFEHLQTLSFSYFNQNSVGYIHSRVISDTARMGELVSWSLMDCVWNFTYLVGAIVVMLSINLKLAGYVISILPLMVILFAVFQKKMIAINREIRETNAKITGNFNEGITGAKTIKTLVIEDKIAGHFFKDTNLMKKKSVKSAHIRGLFTGTMDLASSLAIAIVLWKGGYIADSQIGVFSLFMAYAQGMMEPVRWIVQAISDLITTQVNIERYIKLLETKSEVTDAPDIIEKYGDSFHPKTENWEPLKGDIEFDDVTFHYSDAETCVLKHFNLKVPIGTNVAIVGETGAGKSTLVNLICRFFEPTQGRILVDGRDVKERSQLWLHASIGYVLQTPHLFSGTIRDNLLYGNPNATDKEIYQALELVSGLDIIKKMENGLESNVGEGGDLLSTGEKQLISFARAILANPKILILDEATASVDTITEQKIQSAIDTVIKGRTSIVIAHRLSTIRNADIILVVRNGQIVESGKHQELLSAEGYYYNLYTRQYHDEATTSLLN